MDIVFTSGCFDILHAGHVRFLQQARRLGGMLIVGVNSDGSVRRLKGPSRPINPLVERMDVLASLRCVDGVLPFSEDTPCRLIAELRPAIVVKGPGYTRENMPEWAIVESYGGRAVLLDGPPISTTRIIERIQACRS